MIGYTQTPNYYNDYIAHFNPFHDPKNGQFTSKKGGITVSNKELSAYRKRMIEEAPTKAQSPRGANKGWWKNAPEAIVLKYYKKDQKNNKMSKKELKKWYKNFDNDRPSDHIDKYMDEFDKSDEGKKLKKQYRDAWNLDLDKPANAKKFDNAENNYLKKRQAYAVNKFYKNDSKKFKTEQIIYDQYPMMDRFKNVSDQEVKNYLLNEQWKSHKA